MIEAAANTNLRTGRRIVPDYLVENRVPTDQVTDTTSTTIELGTKLLEKATGLSLSPTKVQYVLNRTFGNFFANTTVPTDWAVQNLGLTDRRRRIGGVSIYGGATNPWYDNRYFAMLKRMRSLQQKHGSKTATREEERLLRRLNDIYRGGLTPLRIDWKEEVNGRSKRKHDPEWWRKRVGKLLDRAVSYMNE